MTKALILAGGLGTRLRPLTYTRPKHLLPIANIPHIEHVFDLLQHHGIDEVVLLTSYLAEAFEETKTRAAERGMVIHVTHEVEPLGTAGALKNAEGLLGAETFLAFNGDVLTDFDLDMLLAFHREHGAAATIALTPVDDPSIYGVVPTDPSGKVTGFVEKPPREEAITNLINAGVYVLEPRVLDRIPPDAVVSSEHELFPGMVTDAAGLFAVAMEGYWMDIGTPEKYLQANLDALSGTVSTRAPAPDPTGVLAAEGVGIADGAQVSSSCLGPHVRIGRATVRDSVFLERAEVADGAEIERCVLGAGVRVAAGVKLVGETIADNESLGG